MPFKSKTDRAAYDLAYRLENGEKRKEAQALWRAENSARLRAKEAKRRLQKRAQCLINAARTRARAKGLVFALDAYEVQLQAKIDAGKCELSGERLDLSPGRKPNSPSLDRIEPTLGYVPGNVRIICHALNTALGDWGENAFAPVASAWLRNRATI